jgi:hypothetical protein
MIALIAALCEGLPDGGPAEAWGTDR